MNERAFQVYNNVGKSASGGRSALAHALTKAARLLDRADSLDSDEYAEALRFNRTLWTIIQADLMDHANTLPDILKANIFSLSLFVDRETDEAAANPGRESMAAMIEINRNMAAGLFATPEKAL